MSDFIASIVRRFAFGTLRRTVDVFETSGAPRRHR